MLKIILTFEANPERGVMRCSSSCCRHLGQPPRRDTVRKAGTELGLLEGGRPWS